MTESTVLRGGFTLRYFIFKRMWVLLLIVGSFERLEICIPNGFQLLTDFGSSGFTLTTPLTEESSETTSSAFACSALGFKGKPVLICLRVGCQVFV